MLAVTLIYLTAAVKDVLVVAKIFILQFNQNKFVLQQYLIYSLLQQIKSNNYAISSKLCFFLQIFEELGYLMLQLGGNLSAGMSWTTA